MRASAHKFIQKVLGEGGVRLVSTLFVMLLARYIGAEDFGRYSSALALAAVCIVFVDLGTNAILTREIARHPEEKNRMADTSHFLKLSASVCSWLILWALTHLLKLKAEQRFLTLCLGVVVIGQTLADYFSALLNGIEEMGWEAVLKTVCRLLSLAFGFISLGMHQPLPVIVAHMAFGSVLGYVVAAGIVRYRFKSFGVGFDPVFLKTLVLTSLPLFGSVVFWILYDSQDILLLNYFHLPLRDVGWFSAGMKVIDVVRVYPVLMMGVFFPVLSKLHTSDPPAFRQKQRRLLIFMAATLMLFAGLIYLGAPWIIQVLFKNDFAPASHLLRLLLPSLVAMGLNHIQMQLLIALNQERKLLVGAFIACASNVLLACFLLPRFGTSGACYALLGSETLYFIFLRQLTAANL